MNQRTRKQPNRRNVLQLGGGVLGGLGLSHLLEARALSSQGSSTPDTSVIFVWLPGGPPHMETYDMKPDAPADYRGQFHPIQTNVAGMDVCELLPEHARIADKYTLIRSCAHEFADHGGGHKRFLTGRKPATPTGFVNDAPMVGSMAAKMLEKKTNPNGLCNYIVLGNGRVNPIDVFSFGSAYLGAETHPFRISDDPNSKDFKVQNLALTSGLFEERLADRVSLLGELDQLRRDVDGSRLMDSMDTFNQSALSMITSSQARRAFDSRRKTIHSETAMVATSGGNVPSWLVDWWKQVCRGSPSSWKTPTSPVSRCPSGGSITGTAMPSTVTSSRMPRFVSRSTTR